jgi:hypothetical protein
MAGTPDWYGWYEEKEVDRRQASLKLDEEGHFPPKPKLPTTLEREARERRYDARSNRCTSCFMTIAVGQAECDNCGGHRPTPKKKKFEPKGGRTV